MKILDICHNSLITIAPEKSVKDALQMLIQKHINSLLVVDNTDNVVGIVSIQDIAAATIPPGFQENVSMANAMYKPHFFQEMCAAIKDKPISEIMRTNFLTATPDTNIMAITADFLKNDLYIVPVLDENEKLIGVITRSEIKTALGKAMGLVE